MNDKADPEKHNNFVDPTTGWTKLVEEQQKYMSDKAANKDGWQKVSAEEAQKFSNEGKFVAGVTKDHIAVVAPGKGGYNRNGDFCPEVAQQGRSNLLSGETPPKETMAWSWTADAYKDVEFYVKQ